MSKRRFDIEKAVEDCKSIAKEHIKSWKPVNKSWKTIEGCAYLRLSTDDQVLVEKGSLEQQVYMAIHEAEVRSRQKHRNYKITHFFIEPGVSGSKSDRKEFLALKKAIRLKEYSFVAFKELSRIARDSQIWKQFFRLCQSNNCEIVIRGLPIDPNDPAQILQLDILAVFAEYEAQLTSKRIRESVFSAMITSGKFNSTHKVLGLDPLTVNGERKVGFYQVNEKELKTVKWIMETFVKYGSHQKVIELCNQRGIKNWTGRSFDRHALINLLTNPKYIGKWYLNIENKGAENDSLPERQRYHEIDLPHGAVIPIDLWNKVQSTVKEVAGNLGKNTRVSRVYPLSGGLLRFHDGTSFRGCSGTGKTVKSHYYFNQENNFRIKCELFEQDAIKVVAKLIENSPELQKALKNAGRETQDNIQFLEQRVRDLKKSLERVEDQKKKYLKKMEILISQDATEEEIQLFREEFKRLLEGTNKERAKLEKQLARAERDIKRLRASSFSWMDIAKHARRVQEVMLEKDPVALKRAYRSLFKAIVVGPEDNLGNRTLTYIVKNSDESLEDVIRHNRKVVDSNPRPKTLKQLNQLTFRVPKV